MRRNLKSRRGNTTLEFTLVGIPLMFVLISIFEISRGMWVYHTLANAVRAGVRFAAVHGENCVSNPANSCAQTVGTVSQVIKDAGVGLLPDQLLLTFCAGAAGGPMTCGPTRTLTVCLGDGTVWPPSPNFNQARLDDVEIRAVYPFTSAIALVWPGSRGSNVFPTFNLPASSREVIEF